MGSLLGVERLRGRRTTVRNDLDALIASGYLGLQTVQSVSMNLRWGGIEDGYDEGCSR